MSSTSPDFWKMPPRIKIYEALGSIADGRVHAISDSEALVISSDGSRRYHVRMVGDAISSDDNGSVYRGYLGYPAIAFLMLKGIVPFDERVANMLKGIPWRELNERFKRYDLVEQYVLDRVPDPDAMRRFVDEVYAFLKTHRFRKLQSQQTTLF